MTRHDIMVELYGLAPGEFVAARNASARELRAAGEREAAAVVAKLRRPTVNQWALNMAARIHPTTVAAWAEAADAVREAHEGAVAGRRVDLRGALGDLRARTAELTSVAREWSPRDDLSSTLNELVGSVDATDALRAGLLGADPTLITRDGTGSRPHDAGPTPSRRSPDDTREQDRHRGGRERDVDRARAELGQATAALADAETAAEEANDAHEAARAALVAAADERAEARRRLDAAEARHARAEHELREAARVLTSANEQLTRVQREHSRATSRLGDLEH